tara:strand:+ start:172 stop:963 length:792 start_codon:yes stop_codon:yes gene_type:complete
MSVVLITNSRNGAKNIDMSRQETNRSNLREAINLWKEIIEIDEKEYKSFKDFSSENKDLERLILTTIPSRLTKNHILYGLDSPENISWFHIKKMADEYLNASEWLQINFCKDSTRQSVEEQVQRKMLNEGLQSTGFNFYKCKPSKWVYAAKILSKDEYLINDPQKTRKDIDTFGTNGSANIWIFQKYTKVGGGHQDNVIIETQHFISDSEEFILENNSNDYFIAQLDGRFIEAQTKKIRKNISSGSKVFAGNTEEVINWIKKI